MLTGKDNEALINSWLTLYGLHNAGFTFHSYFLVNKFFSSKCTSGPHRGAKVLHPSEPHKIKNSYGHSDYQ